MQSSGVGNCGNALALPAICRIPFLAIVSMRGEWGEFIPWQTPMGRGAPGLLEAMDVRVFRADRPHEAGETVGRGGQAGAQHPAVRGGVAVPEDDRREAVQGRLNR